MRATPVNLHLEHNRLRNSYGYSVCLDPDDLSSEEKYSDYRKVQEERWEPKELLIRERAVRVSSYGKTYSQEEKKYIKEREEENDLRVQDWASVNETLGGKAANCAFYGIVLGILKTIP